MRTLLLVIVLTVPAIALAQQAQRPAGPAAAQARQAPSGPITIDADRLEVRDRERKAIFSGNVVAVRGEMTVRSTVMTVFYDGDAAGQVQPQQPAASIPGAGGGQQSIRRIEMTGPVLFSQRDQQATGQAAVYERANETLVMTGNVVLTQGQNVVTGPRLVVNLRTNQATVDASGGGQSGQRVRSILVPNDAQQQPATPQPPAQPGAAPAQRPATTR